MPTSSAAHSQPRLPDQGEEAHVRMSFGDHLEELRKRLLRAAIGAALAIGLCMYYANAIIAFLVAPYRESLRRGGFVDTFLNTGPAEVVLTYLSVGFKAGLILAGPWIIYQVWLFIAAGLYQRERRTIYRYITPSILLFLMGVAFFYFVVLPLTLSFFVDFTRYTAPKMTTSTVLPAFVTGGMPTHGFSPETTRAIPSGDAAFYPPIPVVISDPSPDAPATAPAGTLPAAVPAATTQAASQPAAPTLKVWYNITEGRLKARIGTDTLTFVTGQEDSLFTPFPKLDEYLRFVTLMALAFGICFELPMIMLILGKVGIVRVRTFRRVRKYAYFVICVAACLLTPDVMSMALMMVPLMGLYELGIIVTAILVPQMPEEASEDETPESPPV